LGNTPLCNAPHQGPTDRPSDDSQGELTIAIQFGKKMRRLHFRVFQQNRPVSDSRPANLNDWSHDMSAINLVDVSLILRAPVHHNTYPGFGSSPRA